MRDENDKFWIKQNHWLEKLTKGITTAKMEVEKLMVTNDQQKDGLLELEFQMKNFIN